MGKNTTLPALIGLVLMILSFGQMASAHEYWIEPLEYRVELGSALEANVRVGSDYKGNAMAYFPNNFRSFDYSDTAGTHEIPGRIGDRPAVNFAPELDGLTMLHQFSTSSQLTWDDQEKFEQFVNNHGMGWVLEAHSERGLPDVGFKEAYTRFAKSLVAIGSGAGQDRRVGLILELIAQANPYTDDISSGLPVLLIFDGEPLVDIQVDLFHRSTDGVVSRTHVITDAAGNALMPNLGDGEYMLNAVHMIVPFEADTERTGVVWHSLWASLTYQVLR